MQNDFHKKVIDRKWGSLFLEEVIECKGHVMFCEIH